jgi:hypothetical protein
MSGCLGRNAGGFDAPRRWERHFLSEPEGPFGVNKFLATIADILLTLWCDSRARIYFHKPVQPVSLSAIAAIA